MNPTTQLDRLGQRLWLDNITRDLLVSGTLQRYMRDFAISGLTSNPTIFDHAIRNTNLYDEAISEAAAQGRSGEALFLDLAMADVTAAADLFRPIHDATAGNLIGRWPVHRRVYLCGSPRRGSRCSILELPS